MLACHRWRVPLLRTSVAARRPSPNPMSPPNQHNETLRINNHLSCEPPKHFDKSEPTTTSARPLEHTPGSGEFRTSLEDIQTNQPPLLTSPAQRPPHNSCSPTVTSPVLWEQENAFAWFSDLLVEHAEIFWSLFAVDMDVVLEDQPADTWDSFPLFQVLNDYLRMDENLSGGRFHQHLRDTFAPQVVRYVDLMEASIAQSLQKGFEKEKWEVKGRAGCATSEELFWKLGALQSFIRDLHWPDAEFAKHLEQRLKLMAFDMLEATVNGTVQAFQMWQRKGTNPAGKLLGTAVAGAGGTSTEWLVPSEMCAMINVVLETRSQSLKLCTVDGADIHQYHAKIDQLCDGAMQDMQGGLLAKLESIMESTLSKLSRYDEGSLLAPILSLTYRQGMSSSGKEVGQCYVNFVRNSMEQLRQKVSDELWVLNLFELWYSSQMTMLCAWLSERMEHGLHSLQLSALLQIARKLYSDFELQGIEEEKLNSKTYQTICSRLQLEEAAASVQDVAREKDDAEDFTGESAGRPTTANAGASNDLLGGQGSPLNRVQNVTQNLTGRVSALTRGVGGLANKFSGLGGFF
ncbi:Ca2+-dependent activator protein for secretion 2 isoform A-like [Tropilaelaps mercedesae]|uniref:Ca2+-dependent activator protein for secretion 2 isoform A-like n=1 Tax=Tropilaelaps mercedesae TaxID=418985 RepID=A0A1V9X4D9_9ACAR|nr:Ca2+-dependent activator protein for secretion 2 isoform A-like [Tropilaelaps mercedesae]